LTTITGSRSSSAKYNTAGEISSVNLPSHGAICGFVLEASQARQYNCLFFLIAK
jgi:hypothetical protein